jgi:hypothetical protein
MINTSACDTLEQGWRIVGIHMMGIGNRSTTALHSLHGVRSMSILTFQESEVSLLTKSVHIE